MINARSDPHDMRTETAVVSPLDETTPAQPNRRSKQVPPISPRQAETARYIGAMSGEMATMAKGVGLTLLAHFLAMTQAEAEDAAERAA